MKSGERAGTGTNQEGLRRHNLGTLLRHIHRSGPLSRAELTARMELNRSTIAGLVAELEELGMTEQAPGSPTGRPGVGRPSSDVRPSDSGPYVVAVDVGVDHVTVAGVGLSGAVHDRSSEPVDPSLDPAAVAAQVVRLIDETTTRTLGSLPLVGIGIAVPGLVHRADGLVRVAPNLGWVDVGFVTLVADLLGADVPIRIGNDADLGALAEHERGAGVGATDLIYLAGNIGVGAGVIAGARRIEGVGGYAGEVGHLPFNGDGPLCHCGNRGCWEISVGGPAIAASLGLPPERMGELAVRLASLSEGTPQLRQVGTDLGDGLGSLVNVLNPQMIVLGGFLSWVYGLVRSEVDTALAGRALRAAAESVTVSLPGLGEDSVLLGASEIAFDSLFADPAGALLSASNRPLPRFVRASPGVTSP